MSKKTMAVVAGTALGLVAFAALFFVLRPTSLAQSEPLFPKRTLSVSAQGSVSAVPDVLQARLAVETNGATLDDALSENNTRMAGVLAQLKAMGVADEDVQTTEFFINEVRDRDGNFTGFRVSNGLLLTARSLDQAGALLDQALQAGANRVSQVQLSVSDTSGLLSQARALAVKNARAQAQELADAAGMFLGNPLTISASGAAQPVAFARAAALESVSGAVPLAAGSQRVSVTVNITFELF